ncbi:hypothetical protein D8B26_000046 [Coccidioides posadasii str. Silveira]|uniref:BTB/POZ domain containing protein n=1 Tax=Coccidioides posadasii (strain C735) TaxID=222929 RepID=C5PCF8_COCP7|nr:BTB/POZ domain containing protein [Coccidioides posadasii C735 delta SOWgp]EER25635.1 BTB/POZ domain containing protein [Coccidioides posadasii C735 delta SOWgp]QVM05335.1 hypothetical protein D8B26_000046 [Coccidioides posadasii str. Silveira]|eukprot:XP_003067780.1 BTB/POZ domain containing protein [Coccidioides posadasii C735 delta SOWgp]
MVSYVLVVIGLVLKHGRFRGVTVITITVGESEAQFQAHKDLLCQKSPFFNGALTSDFKEAAEHAITLPEDDPDTFERFLQWVYSGTYVLSGIGSDEEVDERYMQLAQLYVLADKLEVPALKHNIINEMFLMKLSPGKPPQVDVISYVYENTRVRSPLRQLIVAWLVWHVDFEWYKTANAMNFLPQCPEFAADLAVALARRFVDFNMLDPFTGSPDNFYHEGSVFPYVQSPTSDNPKHARLGSTKKQPLAINTSATQQSNPGLRPMASINTIAASGVGGSRIGSSMSLRTSEPLRSPGLFSSASSDTAQTPTLSSSQGFGYGSGAGSSSASSNGFG